MKIMKKAKAISDFVATPQAAEVTAKLQEQAVGAILGGINDPAWEEYARNFCSNADQLARLKGEDGMFEDTWGKLILAYFPGDGTCTGGTTFRIGRNMIDTMKERLDSPSLNSETDPDFVNPIDEFIEPFL